MFNRILDAVKFTYLAELVMFSVSESVCSVSWLKGIYGDHVHDIILATASCLGFATTGFSAAREALFLPGFQKGLFGHRLNVERLL